MYAYIEKYPNEIKSIFDAQLAKPGAPSRDLVVEELIKYTYQLPVAHYEAGGEFSTYRNSRINTQCLITIANLVDSVNNNDKHSLASHLDAMFDANTYPIQASLSMLSYFYLILSNKDRKSFDAQIKEAIASKSSQSPEEIIQEFLSMKPYEALKNSNNQTESEIKQIKARTKHFNSI